MDDKNLTQTIAENLANYRKLNGFTQAELAEKINYSDKSVSKWERAEGVPDIYVLNLLAEIYGITVNDLISEKTETPLPEVEKPKLKTRQKIMVPFLSAGLVWLIASIVFFVLKVGFPDIEKSWLVFIYAIPISCIILIVFTNLWWDQISRCLSVSALVWSVSTCIFLTFPTIQNVYFIYVIAGILQVLVILWYLMFLNPNKFWMFSKKNEGSAENE